MRTTDFTSLRVEMPKLAGIDRIELEELISHQLVNECSPDDRPDADLLSEPDDALAAKLFTTRGRSCGSNRIRP
jgi:hypothetical protein